MKTEKRSKNSQKKSGHYCVLLKEWSKIPARYCGCGMANTHWQTEK